ncbi:hypothetical protein NDU88_009971 [Pleurodeles waltl]|uniref:Uncharacterized protein n=1 Tax=Pleurodeles waltl TaxID=8319 RepID=A0AAV7PWM2_PLEWA|nr:hypothetical protein NDU88_009971 [Pleurodeles waltl]
MRTTLNSRLLSGIVLFIMHTGIHPTCSLLANVSSTGSSVLSTTASGVINSSSASSILLNTTQGHSMMSPYGHGNASAQDILHTATNDVHVSSTTETTNLITGLSRGEEKIPGLLSPAFNNSDILGFIVPLTSPDEKEAETSNNTAHTGTNLALESGTNSSGTDQLESSEFWSTNSTMKPPNMTQGISDDTYEHRTSAVEMMASSVHFQTIYSHKNGVRKKAELKGPFTKELPRVTGKMLVLFFGIVGALVCLLILIYVIYSRTHKSEMFSHHRLYGEGFEDPVLHLDTPMDHYDFFSFSDSHEHSPHTLQKLQKAGGEVPQPPAGLSHPTRTQETIQLESLDQNKNFV